MLIDPPDPKTAEQDSHLADVDKSALSGGAQEGLVHLSCKAPGVERRH